MKNTIDLNTYQAVLDYYSAKVSESKMQLIDIFDSKSKNKMDNIDKWITKLTEADDKLGSFKQFFESTDDLLQYKMEYPNIIDSKNVDTDEDLIQSKLHFLQMNCFNDILSSKLNALETFIYDIEYIKSYNKNDVILNKMIELEDHIFKADELINSMSKNYNLIDLRIKNIDVTNVKSCLKKFEDNTQYGMLGIKDDKLTNAAFSVENITISNDNFYITGDVKFLRNRQGYDAAFLMDTNKMGFEMKFDGIKTYDGVNSSVLLTNIKRFYALENNYESILQ